MTGGPTLALTPWAHEALSLAEMRELGQRAVRLHCRLAVTNSRHTWTIRVKSWATDERNDPIHRVDRYQQRGHLADLMHAAIDEYERRFVFSADELMQIARQSAA